MEEEKRKREGFTPHIPPETVWHMHAFLRLLVNTARVGTSCTPINRPDFTPPSPCFHTGSRHPR